MFFFRLGKKIYGKDEGQDGKPSSFKQVQKTQEKYTVSTDVPFAKSTRPSSPRETGFKERTQYEVVLEYDLSKIKRPFRYHRIGMKSWLSFEEAVQDITKFVNMLNNVSSNKVTKDEKVVRIIGIYEEGAFKDWSKDPYNAMDSNKMKEHIKEALALGKKASKGKLYKPVNMKSEDMKVR